MNYVIDVNSLYLLTREFDLKIKQWLWCCQDGELARAVHCPRGASTRKVRLIISLLIINTNHTNL